MLSMLALGMAPPPESEDRLYSRINIKSKSESIYIEHRIYTQNRTNRILTAFKVGLDVLNLDGNINLDVDGITKFDVLGKLKL